MKNSLLIGNGLNRACDSDFPKWDDLLLLPIKEKKEYKNFVDIQKIQYPLKFEYIVNYIQRMEGDFNAERYLQIKELIRDELWKYTKGKRLSSKIAEALRSFEVGTLDTIMTTNYDTLLENEFYHPSRIYASYAYRKKIVNRMKNEKNSDAEILLKKTDNIDGVDFFHIHGIDEEPRSICLGYEHYVRIIQRLRREIIGINEDRKPKILSYLCDSGPKKLEKEYVARFFDHNIHILGLGLDDQEVDLWWILCYRAYLYYSNIHNAKDLIKNRIIYYDVHRTKTTTDGYSSEKDYQRKNRARYENMHIEYKPLEIKGETPDGQYKEKYIKALKMIAKDCRNSD